MTAHNPFNRYRCPRCGAGHLIKLTDAGFEVDRRFHCNACDLDVLLDEFPPLVVRGGWGSNNEELNS